jgi:hypothetical protein
MNGQLVVIRGEEAVNSSDGSVPFAALEAFDAAICCGF